MSTLENQNLIAGEERLARVRALVEGRYKLPTVKTVPLQVLAVAPAPKVLTPTMEKLVAEKIKPSVHLENFRTTNPGTFTVEDFWKYVCAQGGFWPIANASNFCAMQVKKGTLCVVGKKFGYHGSPNLYQFV